MRVFIGTERQMTSVFVKFGYKEKVQQLPGHHCCVNCAKECIWTKCLEHDSLQGFVVYISFATPQAQLP